MGNSPTKAPRLNSEYSDSFTSLTCRSASNLIVCQPMFNSSGKTSKAEYRFQRSSKMNPYSTMNHTQSDTKFLKKESCILQNIINAFGICTNAVSKITNYIFNINNPLSLMPNEVTIFPEYLIENLNRTKKHSLTRMGASINILESVKNEMLHDKLQLIEMDFFDTQQMKSASRGKLINSHNKYFNTWVNSVHNTEKDFKRRNKINDTFNSEKLSYHLNKIKNLCNREMINITPDDYIPDYLTRNIKLQISKINDNLLYTEITTNEFGKSPDMQMPTKDTMPVKMWRKHNFIVRSRSKGRGKLQLRKSGVSQLKHIKEKLKQNLNYNNQDDMDDNGCMDIWVEENQIVNETFVDNCISSTSTMKLSISVKPKPKQKTNDMFYNPVQPTKHYLNNTCNIEARTFDSSNDSDDSCSIIFDSETDLDCTDFGCKWPSGDETESDDNIDHTNHKVRFVLEPSIHVMIKWDFAYRAARRGPWEEIARDRERFRSRIKCISKVLDPILSLQHRERIYQNRFIVCN